MQDSFANLEGGIYQGFATASFEIEFTVPASVDYDVAGTFNIDPDDVLWSLQLSDGPGGFLVNNATEAADVGNFREFGTLQPVFTYTLKGSVRVLEQLASFMARLP